MEDIFFFQFADGGSCADSDMTASDPIQPVGDILDTLADLLIEVHFTSTETVEEKPDSHENSVDLLDDLRSHGANYEQLDARLTDEKEE